ncbi:hypothetical protein ACP6L2_07190 [Sphingobacterium lactis]|uniref:Cupin domain n=1 Tax=Sphingobacterium kyonggiense TaxID=714075 RepID=A0ABP7YL83_9SPHI
MEIVRVYADEHGDTFFEDVHIPLVDQGDIGFLSEGVPVKQVIFRKVKPSYDYDFHTAPQKQYVVLLDGEIEIETSLGDKRVFFPGQILLLEDTEGKGHKTRNLKEEWRFSLFITV